MKFVDSLQLITRLIGNVLQFLYFASGIPIRAMECELVVHGAVAALRI